MALAIAQAQEELTAGKQSTAWQSLDVVSSLAGEDVLESVSLEMRVAGLSLESCITKRDGISFGTCTDWHYYIVLNSRIRELALKAEAAEEDVIDLVKESDTPRTPV